MSFNAFAANTKKALAGESGSKESQGPKMKAVKTLGAGECAVAEVDVPQITDPDEIIVQVKAVSLNPTDWKRALGGKPTGGGGGIVANVTPDLVCGCDFAGIVTETGGGYDTRKLKVGDRVAGFIMGAKFPGHGSFAEYLKTEGTLVWKIPEGTSFEEAAAMGGISQHTAFMMMFLRSSPPLPRPDNPISEERSFPILIWAGATACGIYCIQYAKAAGLKVVTTASPGNHQLLKGYGADACYDYNDPEVVSKIKKDWPDIRFDDSSLLQTQNLRSWTTCTSVRR
ncbi:GroES-like protein [Atractiella rhizophila]|nr:GroES-like protein [Atractiella rhizophila]